MLKDPVFKAALTISLGAHLALVGAWHPFHANKPEDKTCEIEVNYVIEEPAPEKILETLPEHYDLEKK